MNRRERLRASIEGRAVDRPPVCFYEINGYDEKPDDPDPLNIYSHPSWKPALDLAREKTDRIVMRPLPWKNGVTDPVTALRRETREWIEGSLFLTETVEGAGHSFIRRARRDPDVNTWWVLDHYLKDADDLQTWLALMPPSGPPEGEPDEESIRRVERDLGDTGIVMLNVGDPLYWAAKLFDMATFTLVATLEPELFHAALEWRLQTLLPQVEAVARALPGRLWRIVGPEFASPPYLSPRLFREYVTCYDTPIVEAIQKHGGFARIHSHGRLCAILDDIAATGCTGLDPIEPPPQGDVELSWVRERYGRQMTLFGNLEASDQENLETPRFREKIAAALREGTVGEGRGFVLQPSACPYGRVLSDRALRNYEAMVEMVEGM
ncbi:MAG TPA: uroporphyrinogen decarboxylase family protein [Candidatus Sumerlaeota bacterium]|nr:uroporphyrinogen decarboxylase family protein [Candidatus Sumerlaeota bacterium]